MANGVEYIDTVLQFTDNDQVDEWMDSFAFIIITVSPAQSIGAAALVMELSRIENWQSSHMFIHSSSPTSFQKENCGNVLNRSSETYHYYYYYNFYYTPKFIVHHIFSKERGRKEWSLLRIKQISISAIWIFAIMRRQSSQHHFLIKQFPVSHPVNVCIWMTSGCSVGWAE